MGRPLLCSAQPEGVLRVDRFHHQWLGLESNQLSRVYETRVSPCKLPSRNGPCGGPGGRSPSRNYSVLSAATLHISILSWSAAITTASRGGFEPPLYDLRRVVDYPLPTRRDCYGSTKSRRYSIPPRGSSTATPRRLQKSTNFCHCFRLAFDRGTRNPCESVKMCGCLQGSVLPLRRQYKQMTLRLQPGASIGVRPRKL